jgi:hypothetical protein
VAVEGGRSSGDSVSTRLEGDLAPILSTEAAADISAYNFVWSDSPYFGNDGVTAYGWTNGARIKGLPSGFSAISL